MKIIATKCFNDSKFGEISINRMNRKTLSLSIDPKNKKITVKAPILMEELEIEDFIINSHNWITRHLKMIDEKNKENHSFTNGDSFYYLGKAYPLEFGEIINFTGNSFRVIDGDIEYIKAQLRAIYKHLAKYHIIKQTNILAKELGFSVNEVKIGSAKKRFGVCNNRGKITFPWRLVMFPEDVINYVIIHELTHLIEFNHSVRFWNKVAELIPDYQEKKQFLKDNSLLMSDF